MARKKKNDGGIWWMPYMWIIVFAGCIWYGLAHDSFWLGVLLCVLAVLVDLLLFCLWWSIFTPDGRKASLGIPEETVEPVVPYWDQDELHTEAEEGYKSGYLEGYDEGYEKGRGKAEDICEFGEYWDVEKLEEKVEKLRYNIVGPVFPDNIPDEYFDAYRQGYKTGRRDGYKDGLSDGYDDNAPTPDTGGAWVPGIGIGGGMGGG